MTGEIVLALDFGGTKHSAAITEAGSNTWLGLRRQASPPGADARTDLQIAFRLAHALIKDTSARPSAVGVSFGGPVDYARGVVRLSHHVAGWETVPLREMVEAEFGVAALVDNDANCGALGEWRFGAGRRLAEAAPARYPPSLLYLTISTGIGGGWVIDGEVYRGAEGMAGEIGHVTVDPAGPVCVCGRRGCLEILACGPAIARRARQRLAAEPNSGDELRRLCLNDLDAISAALVSQAAAAGDELAESVLLAAAHDLGLGIASALSLMNPSVVVLGGGVTNSGERWWQAVRQAARGNTLPEIPARIEPAALGEDAPLWGAVALCI